MKLRASHPAKRDYSIQALQQGMQVLDALLGLCTPLNLEQICDHTGLPESAAFRVMVKLLKGAGLGCLEEKSRLPENIIHKDVHPQAKSIHYSGVPVIYPIFAQSRLRRLHTLLV